MQSSIENLSSISTLLKITVPVAEFVDEYNKRVLFTAKTVRVPGFRPGKVPANIVKQQYGMSIYNESVGHFCKLYIDQICRDNEIEFFGLPKVTVKSEPKLDVDLEIEVTLEVIPKLELKPLNELNIEVVNADVTDEDVDALIERLRTQQSIWEVAEDEVVADGKLVKINFVGRTGDVEFPGGKANDFSLEVGKTQMIPGFTEQIIGHKANDKFTIDVKFPDDYHATDLAGKDAQFDIEVLSVSNRKLPELDASFMSLFGVNDGNLDNFKAEIKKNMQRELIHAIRRVNSNAVFNALLAQYGDFDIPQSLIEFHEEEMLKQTMDRFKRYGIKDESFFKKFKDENLTKEAAKRARTSVLYSLMTDSLDINGANKDYVEEELTLVSQAYEEPEKTADAIRKDQAQFSRIEDAAFERTLVESILAQANVTHAQKSFSDLVR